VSSCSAANIVAMDRWTSDREAWKLRFIEELIRQLPLLPDEHAERTAQASWETAGRHGSAPEAAARQHLAWPVHPH